MLRNLKPGPRRMTIWGPNGLACRITPRGVRTWVFTYRFDAKFRWMTFGNYPKMSIAQAHAKHGEALEKLDRGIDPALEVAQARRDAAGALTVAGLVSEFIEKHAKPYKRSWKDDERLLTNEILAHVGDRRAEDLRRRDVVEILDGIVERGSPVTANRVRAALLTAYNWSLGRDLIEVNPIAGVPRPAVERPKDRALAAVEIRALVRRLDQDAPGVTRTVRLALRFILATAQRPGEVAGAAWSEFDIEAGWWHIPAARTKNGRAHSVPISDHARAILDATKALNPGADFPFPAPGGQAPMRPLSLAQALRRSLKRWRKDLDFRNVEAFTPHDLRRTAATALAAAGTPRVVLTRILNHADKSITAVYDRHAYDLEAVAAMRQWGEQLDRLAAEAPAPATRKARSPKTGRKLRTPRACVAGEDPAASPTGRGSVVFGVWKGDPR